MKPHLTETGEKEMDVISTSQALQIAGRAGRYNTAYQDGEVTTFRSDDLNLLKDVVSRPIDPIEVGDHCVMPWCLYPPSLCLQRLWSVLQARSELSRMCRSHCSSFKNIHNDCDFDRKNGVPCDQLLGVSYNCFVL